MLFRSCRVDSVQGDLCPRAVVGSVCSYFVGRDPECDMQEAGGYVPAARGGMQTCRTTLFCWILPLHTLVMV